MCPASLLVMPRSYLGNRQTWRRDFVRTRSPALAVLLVTGVLTILYGSDIRYCSPRLRPSTKNISVCTLKHGHFKRMLATYGLITLHTRIKVVPKRLLQRSAQRSRYEQFLRWRQT